MDTQERTINKKGEETMDTKEVINTFAEAFEHCTRDNGETYIDIKPDSPYWVMQVVKAGHMGNLPSNLYFKEIATIAYALKDALDNNPNYNLDDMAEVVVDNLESDYYTAGLTGWLDEFEDHIGYLTEALDNYDKLDGVGLLSYANLIWKHEVLFAVIEALKGVIDR